jgi:fucose permease
LVLSLATVSIPALAYLFVVNDGYGMFVGIFVVGFCVSGFFPTLSAFGIDTAPTHGGPVNAIAISANFLGLSLVPVVMGIVSDRATITTAMRLLIVSMGILALVVLAARYVVGRRTSLAPDHS